MLYQKPISPWRSGYLVNFCREVRDELLGREMFCALRGSKRAVQTELQPHQAPWPRWTTARQHPFGL